ncbi:MAG: hypothetical protein ABIR11_06390 [Candidatus Limnocylindrales bacterium]
MRTSWRSTRGPALVGWASVRALLERVVAHYRGRDISADVLVGNDLGEPFHVARGFEPGDLLDEELGGVTIREPRWWLRAAG